MCQLASRPPPASQPASRPPNNLLRHSGPEHCPEFMCSSLVCQSSLGSANGCYERVLTHTSPPYARNDLILPAGVPCTTHRVPQGYTGKTTATVFIKLPNSLPSHPPEVKQESSAPYSQQQQQQQEEKPSDSNKHEEEEKKASQQHCTQNTLPKGKIGTVKVYKSGKVELWLGNHKLSVSKGTQVAFLQDVVNVDVDQEAKTGAMIVLGYLGHRLVCTPDLKELVRHWLSLRHTGN